MKVLIGVIRPWIAKTQGAKMDANVCYLGLTPKHLGLTPKRWDYAWNAKRLVHKWFNCRSQRRSYNWITFDEAWERWKIPSPQIFEKPWPQARQNHSHPVDNVQPIRVQS